MRKYGINQINGLEDAILIKKDVQKADTLVQIVRNYEQISYDEQNSYLVN